MHAVIASLYTLISSLQELPIPVTAFFVIILFEFVVVIHFMFKMLADPYLRSLDFVREMKGRRNGKWFKRFLKSCAPLKLAMGGGSYFDRLTSLVIWGHCVDMVVTLLVA